jgi:large subunit ribosomal protein L4
MAASVALRGMAVSTSLQSICNSNNNRISSSLQCGSPAMAAPSRRGNVGVARARVTSVPVITFDGTSSGSAEISLKTARPETAGAVVHRGVVTELQNRRRGTASTLTRSEVRGGGRKPFKQKGTGQARMGSKRTPLRPGGGVVFGPKPVDWRIKMNKKEKQLAISTAMQSAAVDALVVEDLQEQITTSKTSTFIAALKRWGVDPAKHSLIFATEVSKELELSSRNIKTLKILTPRSLNLYDILRADRVLFTKSGLQYLNDTYGAGEFLTEEEAGETVDVSASEPITEEAASEPSAEKSQ